MTLWQLALKSLGSRKLVVTLLLLSIGLSTTLLVGVEKIKTSARTSFSSSISGTDLIVGSRSGDLQLLLYTVFRVGKPVATMSWESVQAIAKMPTVDWVIPISLGDSHRGFSVVGTTRTYFDVFEYGKKKSLLFANGHAFSEVSDVVIGAAVAAKLGYTIGDRLYLSHGTGSATMAHDQHVFSVTGILASTGTPVDHSVHVSLDAITALHQPKDTPILAPKTVTGCFVKLRSKLAIFSVQRTIIDQFNEPLSAIIPGVALTQLWASISTIDQAFFVITILVTLVAFIGLLLALFMSLSQRQRELALLRAMGCHPSQVFILLILEALLITVGGVGFGFGLLLASGTLLSPILEGKLGLSVTLHQIGFGELGWGLLIVLFGSLISTIPAFLAYRKRGIGGMLGS